MDIQDLETILKIIRSSRLKDFADTLIKSAIKYAHIRAEWCYLSQEEKNELEDERRIAHDAFISNCDILYRFSSKMEKTVKLTWSVKIKFFLFSRFSTHSLTFMFS